MKSYCVKEKKQTECVKPSGFQTAKNGRKMWFCHCASCGIITTKNIPAGINRRLSSLSSDKASFDQAVPPYQKALDESGYHYTLQYEPSTTNRRKNRQRNNIIWCNPPFSKNTSTNIGYKFLALIDKHFPKDHKLRKIFNRNTIKISYSCMNNAKQIIDNHNKQILKSYTQANDTATANPNTAWTRCIGLHNYHNLTYQRVSFSCDLICFPC